MKTVLVNFVQVLKTVKITRPALDAAAFVVAAAVTGVDAAAAAAVVAG